MKINESGSQDNFKCEDCGFPYAIWDHDTSYGSGGGTFYTCNLCGYDKYEGDRNNRKNYIDHGSEERIKFYKKFISSKLWKSIFKLNDSLIIDYFLQDDFYENNDTIDKLIHGLISYIFLDE